MICFGIKLSDAVERMSEDGILSNSCNPCVERQGEKSLECGTIGWVKVGSSALLIDVWIDVAFLGVDLLGIRMMGTYQNL